MASRTRRSILLAVIGCLAMVFILLATLGMMSPVLALERVSESLVRLDPLVQIQAPGGSLVFTAVLTEHITTIADQSGNDIGPGLFGGDVRCNTNNCSKGTLLQFIADPDQTEYEYKFTDRLALDPIAERALVAGTGTISRLGQKERFSFTAVFQNNRDGTVSVTYEASIPDASFVIPQAPGTFNIFSRQ